MVRVLKGKPVVSGAACGEALVSNEPISFWGGIDPRTGEVIDRRHELSGANVTGKIFVFPTGRGSSTASAILLEAVRTGAAPAAIINLKIDPILALGSIVADEMYKRTVPIVLLDEDAFSSIKQGDRLTLETDGTVKVEG